jgi:hypothetical protein
MSRIFFYENGTLFSEPIALFLLKKRKYFMFIRKIEINKILSKYIHVGSYFKGFIARNLMV